MQKRPVTGVTGRPRNFRVPASRLHGFFFFFLFQTNDGGGKSGNGTLNLGSRGLINDPTLFRNSVLLGLGFPMFEGYEGIVGRSYRSSETDPASRT